MITLKVEDYCHNCPMFEPEVERHCYCTSEFTGGFQKEYTDTVVKCSYGERCAAMKEYIEKEKNG